MNYLIDSATAVLLNKELLHLQPYCYNRPNRQKNASCTVQTYSIDKNINLFGTQDLKCKLLSETHQACKRC